VTIPRLDKLALGVKSAVNVSGHGAVVRQLNGAVYRAAK